MEEPKHLIDARRLYSELMASYSSSADPRLQRICETVPREAFLPPGPWHIRSRSGFVRTPSGDPALLYQNVLVALDPTRGINNGEPFLHAAWLGAVGPQRSEVVTQIGAGLGYYTAILAMLVLPGGRVEALEIEEHLARAAGENLLPFENVTVQHADGSVATLAPSDVIYVNAGVVAPPVSWLQALRPGGRMIFPWSPKADFGVGLLVTRNSEGFAVQSVGRCRFIPCFGASEEVPLKPATFSQLGSVQSIWLTAETNPDETAIAIYRDVWFSSRALRPARKTH